MMAPALLAALVVTSALVDQRQLGVGADTVGVLAGGVLLWRGHSVVLAVRRRGRGHRGTTRGDVRSCSAPSGQLDNHRSTTLTRARSR